MLSSLNCDFLQTLLDCSAVLAEVMHQVSSESVRWFSCNLAWSGIFPGGKTPERLGLGSRNSTHFPTRSSSTTYYVDDAPERTVRGKKNGDLEKPGKMVKSFSRNCQVQFPLNSQKIKFDLWTIRSTSFSQNWTGKVEKTACEVFSHASSRWNISGTAGTLVAIFGSGGLIHHAYQPTGTRHPCDGRFRVLDPTPPGKMAPKWKSP